MVTSLLWVVTLGIYNVYFISIDVHLPHRVEVAPSVSTVNVYVIANSVHGMSLNLPSHLLPRNVLELLRFPREFGAIKLRSVVGILRGYVEAREAGSHRRRGLLDVDDVVVRAELVLDALLVGIVHEHAITHEFELISTWPHLYLRDVLIIVLEVSEVTRHPCVSSPIVPLTLHLAGRRRSM